MTRKIGDIQVLRALAILFVIVHHAYINLITWNTPAIQRFYAYFAGEVGVDLFFVISGFVIARNFLPRLSDSKKNFSTLVEFWVKRFFRIIPSAWFWLLATMLFTLCLNQSGAFGSFRSAFEGSVAAILQVANIRFAQCYGHFECGPTTIYWSLSLEEQFYLALPFIALLCKTRLPTFLIAFILSQIFVPWLMLPSYFRTTGIALGVLLAWYCHSPSYLSLEPTYFSRNRLLNNTILLVLLICLTTVLSHELHIASGNLAYNLAAIISAILVFIASFNSDYLLCDGLAKRLLIWLGDRSYALYLTHMPAFFLTRELFHRFQPELVGSQTALIYHTATAALLMLLFAELSYRFIETPLQRKGAKLLERRRQQLSASGAGEVPHVQ